MNETTYSPNIPQVPKFDGKATSQLSPNEQNEQVDSQQSVAENQLEVIESTRQEIHSREKQAAKAVEQLSESLNNAENIQVRSALLAWVHESIAQSGKLNILKFKSGTYATAEVKQQKIATVQVELKKAQAELQHIQENKDVWLDELDKRAKYFGDQANKKHSDALKRNNAANENFAPDANPRFPDRKQLGFLVVEAAQAARADLLALGILDPSETLRKAATKAAEAKLLERKVNSGGNSALKAEIQGKYSAKPEVRAETEDEAADRKAFEFLKKEHINIRRRTFDAGLRKWATNSRLSSEVQSHSKEAQAQLIACAKLKEQAVDMTEDSREVLPTAVLDQFEEVGGTLMEGIVSNIKDNKSGGLMNELLTLSTKLQREVKGEDSSQISYDYFDALSPQFVGAVALDALFTLHNIPEGKQRVACTLAFIAGFSASYEGYSAQRAISDWLTGVAPIDPPLVEKNKVKTPGSSPLVTRRYERAQNPTGEQKSLGLFWRTKLSHDYSFGRASSSVLSRYSELKTATQRQTDSIEIAALEESNTAMYTAANDAYYAAKAVVNEVNGKLLSEMNKHGLSGTYAGAIVNLELPSLEISR